MLYMDLHMQMTSNAYKNIRLFLIVFATVALILGCISYAKGQTTTTSEKVEEVQQQVQATDQQLDLTTVGVVGGTAASVAAIVKGVMDQKTNTKRDRTTDKDAGRYIILQAKFYQAKKLYPEMTDSELLDLPVSNNPFATQTFGQAFTTEAELWADGNATYWGIQKPNMSVPTKTTVEAMKASKIAPPSPPPDNNPQTATAAAATTAATAKPTVTTTTTNTTVGK